MSRQDPTGNYIHYPIISHNEEEYIYIYIHIHIYVCVYTYIHTYIYIYICCIEEIITLYINYISIKLKADNDTRIFQAWRVGRHSRKRGLQLPRWDPEQRTVISG